MSKRFGRARRRKMREELVACKLELAGARVAMDHERGRATAAWRECAQVVGAVEALSPRSAALPPKMVPPPPGGRAAYNLDELDLDGPLDGPDLRIRTHVLHRLRAGVQVDHLKRAVWVYAQCDGQQSQAGLSMHELYLSREAWGSPRSYPVALDFVTKEVVRALRAALTKPDAGGVA